MTREEAIKVLNTYDVNFYEYRAEEIVDAIGMAIEALSAEAVQGEWRDRSDGGRIRYPWWESCKCNQCGEYGSGAYNYCPNCGAKMVGGDDE